MISTGSMNFLERVSPGVRAVGAVWLGAVGFGFVGGCGGGGDSDTGARASVVVMLPLSPSALAVAPGDALTYRATCSGRGTIQYEWDPGDGSAPISTADNAFVYRYTDVGEYLPRVTCTDTGGQYAISVASAYVHVAVPVITVTRIDVSSVRGPLTTDVTLKGDCVGDIGSSLSYAWDFGDGSSSTGSSATHSYSNSGPAQYTVTLSCTDSLSINDLRGHRVAAPQTVTGTSTVLIAEATAAPRLTKPLSVNPSIPTTAGPTVFSMGCVATNGGALSYQFDFGDGSPVQMNETGSVSHTYSQDGFKQVSQYTARAACIQGGGRNQAQSLLLNVHVPRLSLLAGRAMGNLGLSQGVALDSSGNMYVSEASPAGIRKISPKGVVSTLAGGGTSGFTDGVGSGASFNQPAGLAVDRDGNVYVADTGNNAIRKISPAGVVTTLAGNGAAGMADGTGPAASFNAPRGVVVDAAGGVYVADTGSHAIRKISTAGAVTTLAVGLGAPTGIALDSSGNVYVPDSSDYRVYKVSPTGAVTTFAGGDGNPGPGFNHPRAVAVDGNGHVYVADTRNYLIRKVSPGGVVSTLAGGAWGVRDGTGTAASFNYPVDVAVDAGGSVYVVDAREIGGTALRKVSPEGVVTTLSSSGTTDGFVDGVGTVAALSGPGGVAVDTQGNVYVADMSNHAIRKVSRNGEVTTLAGNGQPGLANGPGVEARFSGPVGVAVDVGGNVYVADAGNNVIRKISATGVVSTLAGSGAIGFEGGAGAAASFSALAGIAADDKGNVYVSDSGNHAVRKISSEGVVTTLAGSGAAGAADGASAVATFGRPAGLAVDGRGHVYVVDRGNRAIRKITESGVETLIGGLDAAADHDEPVGVAVDGSGNVYVAGDASITKITETGAVSIVVGSVGVSEFRSGFLPGSVGRVIGLALSGRRLVFSVSYNLALGGGLSTKPLGDYVAHVDFVP